MTIHFNLHPLVTVHFEQGLGPKFRQPHETGIHFSMFEDTMLLKMCPPAYDRSEGSPKEKGEFQVSLRVVKQILWVNGMRYELHEIYGIGNSVEGDVHK
ncbi:hypothetical protein DVH24_007560 [Malus domestica]|uniref:RING-type E3 ubiquitin transferase n=1 Tax=Malus domestica TaxID=3750 RepID=A0A498HJ05_MALDO|nr:hypothetical protein DVH24_007560 [Malus domestica]